MAYKPPQSLSYNPFKFETDKAYDAWGKLAYQKDPQTGKWMKAEEIWHQYGDGSPSYGGVKWNPIEGEPPDTYKEYGMGDTNTEYDAKYNKNNFTWSDELTKNNPELTQNWNNPSNFEYRGQDNEGNYYTIHKTADKEGTLYKWKPTANGGMEVEEYGTEGWNSNFDGKEVIKGALIHVAAPLALAAAGGAIAGAYGGAGAGAAGAGEALGAGWVGATEAGIAGAGSSWAGGAAGAAGGVGGAAGGAGTAALGTLPQSGLLGTLGANPSVLGAAGIDMGMTNAALAGAAGNATSLGATGLLGAAGIDTALTGSALAGAAGMGSTMAAAPLAVTSYNATLNSLLDPVRQAVQSSAGSEAAKESVLKKIVDGTASASDFLGLGASALAAYLNYKEAKDMNGKTQGGAPQTFAQLQGVTQGLRAPTAPNPQPTVAANQAKLAQMQAMRNPFMTPEQKKKMEQLYGTTGLFG